MAAARLVMATIGTLFEQCAASQAVMHALGLLCIRRDLRTGAPDTRNRLWRAEGNETCALSLSRPPVAASASAAGVAASRGARHSISRAADGQSPELGPAALAAWAHGAEGLLRELRERVCMLL